VGALSSLHGPAMIDIGKSFPNLTDPAATRGRQLKRSRFQALSFPPPTMRALAGGKKKINLRLCRAGNEKAGPSFHRLRMRRRQPVFFVCFFCVLIDDVGDQSGLRPRFSRAPDPFGIALNAVLASRDRRSIPIPHIGPLLMIFTTTFVKNPGLPGAVLLPNLHVMSRSASQRVSRPEYSDRRAVRKSS